jgi:hypothetical protein
MGWSLADQGRFTAVKLEEKDLLALMKRLCKLLVEYPPFIQVPLEDIQAWR